MSSEVFIDHKPKGEISVGEHLAGSIPVEELTVKQPIVKPSNGFSNGASRLQELVEATNERIRLSEVRIPREVKEKQEELARVFREMHLTDVVYDDFKARGRAGASNINGDRLSMEDVRANVRRIFLRGEDPQDANSSSKTRNSSNGNGGVFAENSPRKHTD